MAASSLIVSLLNQAATHQFGNLLGRLLPAGSLILLSGDLGSGKTTLVQGLGSGLGISDPIVSPTFILLNEYFEGRVPLYHFDLYRLEPMAVAALQIEAYWEGVEYPPGIVAIEWSERLDQKPPAYLEILLTPLDPEGRQACLTAVGNFPQEIFDQIKNAFANEGV
ncbi:MAG: tRNA (adenosine(37)-N6)-threonylcarbamoyltransferase complex ATPase subunit type 1 TsaE [Elainellaceae cyanobacterium]